MMRTISPPGGCGSHSMVVRGVTTMSPTQRCTDAAEETAFLLERLSRVGLTKATAIDLTPRDCGAIAVARLVVPGLEPPPEALCRPGRRLVAAGVR